MATKSGQVKACALSEGLEAAQRLAKTLRLGLYHSMHHRGLYEVWSTRSGHFHRKLLEFHMAGSGMAQPAPRTESPSVSAEPSIRTVIAEVERAHFRTVDDTGAHPNAMLVWNAVRRHAGLNRVTLADLPAYCATCMEYHLSSDACEVPNASLR